MSAVIGQNTHALAAQWLQGGTVIRRSDKHYLSDGCLVKVIERLPRPQKLYVKCKVFETPELMERIFFMLSSHDLLRTRQVCIHWRKIITAARRLAYPLYCVDQPTTRPSQHLVVMHYRNLGMKVTEGETLDHHSRPFLLIRLSWRPYIQPVPE